MKTPKPLENLIDSFKRLPGIGPKTAQRLAFYLLRFPQEELESFGDHLRDLKLKTRLCSICKNIDDSDPCSICSDPRRNKNRIIVTASPMDVYALEKVGYSGVYHVLHGVINPLDNIGPDDLYIKDFLERLKEIKDTFPKSPKKVDAMEKNNRFIDETLDSENKINHPFVGGLFSNKKEDKDEKDTMGSYKKNSKDNWKIEEGVDDNIDQNDKDDGVEVILATNSNMEGESTAMYIAKKIKDIGFEQDQIKITRIARGLPVGGDIEYADDITLTRALEGRVAFD